MVPFTATRPLARVTMALALLALAGCATSSHEIVGAPRVPRAPEQVQVFFEPPRGSYELIAVVESSSRYSMAFSSLAKEDVVIARLKREAAALGANAVVLQALEEQPLQALGTSLGAEHEGPRGTVDIGVSGVGVWTQKFGRGLAIYLQSARPGSATEDGQWPQN